MTNQKSLLTLLSVYIILGCTQTNPQESQSLVKNDDSIAQIEAGSQQSIHNSKTPYHATFAIFTNGLKRTFTASMYHYQSEDIYLEPKNPQRIIIAKQGVTWNDFFQTLPFSITSQCLTTGLGEEYCSSETLTLQFYLNTQRHDQVLGEVIQPGDQLLITYDQENNPQLQLQLDSLTDENVKSLK